MEFAKLFYCLLCNEVWSENRLDNSCRHGKVPLTHKQYIEWILKGKPHPGEMTNGRTKKD